jgi:hypothetical protein
MLYCLLVSLVTRFMALCHVVFLVFTDCANYRFVSAIKKVVHLLKFLDFSIESQNRKSSDSLYKG